MIPGYIKLFRNGELAKREVILKNYYKKCSLCPHLCNVDRTKGETGICRSGAQAVVASYTSHHGEEPPLSGKFGSGTIFFSGCSGRCIFCQNYPISQLGTGKKISDKRLSDMMIALQYSGCHNINLVSPTHFIPSIVSALRIAITKGLRLPIVYNTSGYENVEILKLLTSIVDIYLPDAKYDDNKIAKHLSGFKLYSEYNRSALKEMFHQVGNLIINDDIAEKGLIVRHLLLPGGLSGTKTVLKFLSEEISSDMYVSLMDQYFPAYKALHHNILSRQITGNEYLESIEICNSYGLHNGWIQEHST